MASLDSSPPLRSPGGIAALTVERRDDRPFLAIGLTLLAMSIFSAMDGMSKLLAVHYASIEIAWGRFFFILLFLAPVVMARRGRVALRSARPLLQGVRGICMLGSSLFFIAALGQLPIAEASAIGFVSPFLITALSIPLLGEKVGIRRWSAVMVGFLGVLVVVRPGSGAFDPAVLLPIASSAFWALGIIITRKMQATDSVLTTLIYSTSIGFGILSLAVPFVWITPTAEGWALLLVQAGLSIIGQCALIQSFRYAGASLLAPFAYSQLLWSTLIGYFVFHQLPDAATWAGASIIIGSGLYTLHRERVVRRRGAV